MLIVMRRRSGNGLCLQVLSVLALMVMATGAVLAQTSSDQETLREVLLEGYSGIESIRSNMRIVFDSTSESLGGWAPQSSGPRTSAMEYISGNGHERSAFAGEQRAFWVYDGQYVLNWWPTTSTGDTETQTGRAILDHASIGLMESGEGAANFFGWPSMLPEVVLRCPDTVVDTQAQYINGTRAYKATAAREYQGMTYNVAYWFAPELSGNVVRMELRNSNGTQYRRLDVEEFLQLEDGTFFPKETVYRWFAERDGEMVGTQVIRCSAIEVELNSDVDDLLLSTSTAQLPVGTLLHDHVAGERYYIGHGPISQERIDSYMEDILSELGPAMPVAAPEHAATGEVELLDDYGIYSTGAGTVEKGGRRWWPLWVSMAAAAAVALAWIRRRKGARGNG